MSNDSNNWSNGSVFRDELGHLQEQLKVAKQERERQVRQNAEIVLRANALTRERDELRDRLEAAISERDLMVAERASVPDRTVSLERRLDEITREFSDIQTEVTCLQQALADAKTELMTKTEDFERQISDLGQSLTEITEKKDRLTSEKLEAEKRVLSAEANLLQSNAILNELQPLKKRLEHDLIELQKEMTARNSSFTSELSQLNDRLISVTSQRDKFASERSAAIEKFLKTEQQLTDAINRIANNEAEINRLRDAVDDLSVRNIGRLLYAFTCRTTGVGASWIRSTIPKDSPFLPYFDKTIEVLKISVTEAEQVSRKAFQLAKPQAIEIYKRVKLEIDNQLIKK